MKNKILIVDNARFFLDVQQEMLDRIDCDILTARSGLEALKVIKKQKPQLVLMDYQLPDLTGDKACEIIKGDPRFKDIPIMIVSGDHEQTEARANCLAAGADHYLTKPIDQTEFIEAVSCSSRSAAPLLHPGAHEDRGLSAIRGNVMRYDSVDISVTGIFVETDDPLPANRGPILHPFHVPIPRRDVRIDARITKIVTVQDREKYGLFSGMALEFLNLDLEDRKYIEEYVDKSTSIRKRTLGERNHKISYV